jgi:hypothetical protein
VSSLTAGLLLMMAAQSVPAAPPAPPSARLRRGPIESRDEFLLSQPRLTLPALAPDPLPRGRTRVRVAADWGNDFGLETGRVDGVLRVLHLVDGEHRSGALQLSHGLSDRWTVQARVPVLWRGGGVLDGLIDGWHRLTGLPHGNRPDFPRDRLVISALDDRSGAIRWTDPQGYGLGGVEVGARWSGAVHAPGWTRAVDARVQLPTATGPFAGGGVELGAQALFARTLGEAGDLYLGLGGTVLSRPRQDAIDYARVRPQGFAAVEWRPWRPVSLLAEAAAAGRLVRNVDSLPGLHLLLRLGTKVDVARGWRLEGGFTEGLRPISATTDFGLMLALERTF